MPQSAPPKGMPYRLGWTQATTVADVNTRSTKLWIASDQMFEILFKRLKLTDAGTLPDTEVRGDVLTAQGAAPNTAWDILHLGPINTFLHSTGTDVDWEKVGLTTGVTGVLPPANGGTGSGTLFTTGSIIFAGASGVFSQDNANLFWDETNKRLGVDTNTPTTNIAVVGTFGSTSTTHTTSDPSFSIYRGSTAPITYYAKNYVSVSPVLTGSLTRGIGLLSYYHFAPTDSDASDLTRTASISYIETRGTAEIGADIVGAEVTALNLGTGSFVTNGGRMFGLVVNTFNGHDGETSTTGSDVPFMVGIQGAAFQQTDQHTDTIYGINGLVQMDAGSSDTAFGVISQFAGTAPATTLYSFYADVIPATTNRFSFYAADTTAPSYFGGPVGIGTTTPTALLNLAAGTATASTAPLKLTSGTSLTTPEAGAIEFTTDNLFFTITTGPARKGVILNDGTTLTTGRVPFSTTNGRLTDDANLFWDNTNKRLGIGITSPNAGLEVVGSYSVDQAKGADFETTHTTATAGTVYGAVFNTTVTHSSGTMNSVQGLFSQAIYDGTSAASPAVSGLVGAFFRNTMTGANTSGTISNSYGFRLDQVANFMSGSPSVTITNQIGVAVVNQGAGSGTGGLTIGSACGFAIADVTGATNNCNLELGSLSLPSGNYSIYNSSSHQNYFGGILGIGQTSPTAYLHFKAGTNGASTAPIKFAAGTNLTTAEAGAVEWDGTHLFLTQTSGPTRKTVAYTTDIPSFPVVAASTFEKAETGSDANVLTYTAGGTDEFHVAQVAVDVSALTGTSVVTTLTWKDSNNTTQTSSTTLTGVSDGTLNVPINVKTATSVVVSTTFTGVSTAYNISAFLTRLK